MMVVLRVTADVGMATLREQRADGAACAEELDRPVRRGEAETGFEPPGLLVELGDGEAAGRAVDDREHSAALGGRADAGREGEGCGHGGECS